jgi:hypothetical protein
MKNEIIFFPGGKPPRPPGLASLEHYMNGLRHRKRLIDSREASHGGLGAGPQERRFARLRYEWEKCHRGGEGLRHRKRLIDSREASHGVWGLAPRKEDSIGYDMSG